MGQEGYRQDKSKGTGRSISEAEAGSMGALERQET